MAIILPGTSLLSRLTVFFPGSRETIVAVIGYVCSAAGDVLAVVLTAGTAGFGNALSVSVFAHATRARIAAAQMDVLIMVSP